MIANCDHLARLKFSKKPPNAFTEHGAFMAAAVLNSPRAIEMSIFVVRAFVKLRRTLEDTQAIAGKLVQIENKLAEHDGEIRGIIAALRELMSPAAPMKKRQIGFRRGEAEKWRQSSEEFVGHAIRSDSGRMCPRGNRNAKKSLQNATVSAVMGPPGVWNLNDGR